MIKKFILPICLVIFMLFGTSFALADDSDVDADYPWQNHASPNDFTFGNMIDTHQQSSFDRKGVLHGFIYIHVTGVAEDDIPIARKANCEIEACIVGWVIKGIPYQATLVNKGPRIWEIDPAGLPKEPGYTHFHWTGMPYKPHGLILDPPTVYDGYLLKRVAVTTFYWLGGSGQGGSGGGGCSGGGHTGGGGCSGEEGGCSGDEGGCSGEEGGCSGGGMGGGDMGGGDMGGGGCSGEEGGCSGEEGGCSGEEGGCSGEEGGCSGEEGGCSGGGSGGSGSSGHGGRLVTEGLDPHANIVTEWDGTWDGCGSHD